MAQPQEERAFPRSLEHLNEVVGRVALKDIVREATDVIERLFLGVPPDPISHSDAASFD